MIRCRYKVWRFNRWKVSDAWCEIDRYLQFLESLVSLQFGVQLYPVGFVVPLPRFTMYDVPIRTGETSSPPYSRTDTYKEQGQFGVHCHQRAILHDCWIPTCQCLTSKSASHWHDGLPFIPLFYEFLFGSVHHVTMLLSLLIHLDSMSFIDWCWRSMMCSSHAISSIQSFTVFDLFQRFHTYSSSTASYIVSFSFGSTFLVAMLPVASDWDFDMKWYEVRICCEINWFDMIWYDLI